jgi:hypothetical protein
MKEFLYILFCVVILMLGIILLNSKGDNDLFLSEYPVNVSPGVDFSKMNNIQSTYTPPGRVRPENSGSLIGRDLSKNSTSSASSSLPVSPQYAPAPLYSVGISGRRVTRAGNNETNSGVGVVPSVPLIRSGNGGAAPQNKEGGGLIAAGSSTQGNSFRAFVPLSPVDDYSEGDLTHPGGNPNAGDQLVGVPVGDGLLPLFLMGFFYVLFGLLRRKLQKEQYVS